MNTIVLAGGCFWGLQKFFDQFKDIKTTVGYANGASENPTYQQVCAGSGHTEAVKIQYPDDVNLAQLLAVFFAVIDPTSLNRQGNDVGINYRSGIYYTTPEQRQIAASMLATLQSRIDRPVVVELLPLENFYTAEEYHQKYLDKNPTGYCHLPRGIMEGHKLPTRAQVLNQYPTVERFWKDPDEPQEAQKPARKSAWE